MHDELTRNDIKKLRDELEQCQAQMPEILEEVKRTRAFGDLSENYEYKAAKQAQNSLRRRIRYLEGMIKTARIIDGRRSPENAVGLYDKVEVYYPEDDETEIVQIVTTVRCDPRKGFISKESPFGVSILGKRVGSRVRVHISEGNSYDVIIKSVTKCEDDGSAPLMSF